MTSYTFSENDGLFRFRPWRELGRRQLITAVPPSVMGSMEGPLGHPTTHHSLPGASCLPRNGSEVTNCGYEVGWYIITQKMSTMAHK